MKIIAFYLPQFHIIPENDKWWGNGFTEWTNVKRAKSLFKGHEQPKVPLNNNYYNLLDDDVKVWQANLAKKYGIYGFCYYHYWYNGKMLLEKPMEQMLDNHNIDFPFCIWWCNHAWTKAWAGDDSKVLISQKSGDKKEWIDHYKYLRKFFLDKRYILNNNKPVFGIYNPEILFKINEMMECWNNLAIEDGFDGIDFMSTVKNYDRLENNKDIYDNFNHYVEWSFALSYRKVYKLNKSKLYLKFDKYKDDINKKFEKIFGHEIPLYENLRKIKRKFSDNKKVIKYDYDDLWNNTISLKPYSSKSIPGAFVNWDNTPRYGVNGSVMVNASPKKFEHYMTKQIANAKNNYKSDMIFLVAWNEWSEWSVLEPEEKEGYAYLNALKKALINNNEYLNYD